MSSKTTIEPTLILTVCTSSFYNIPLILTDNTSNIITMKHIIKYGKSNYKIRQEVIKVIDDLLNDYKIDTILLEQNKLFIDKIDRYPDPFVLRDILLGFGIQISIEDKYFNKIKYILQIPEYDWKNKILNRHTTYSIDLYKSHIELRGFDTETLSVIDTNNYYKAVCFSECVEHTPLMNRKYQINKENRTGEEI